MQAQAHNPAAPSLGFGTFLAARGAAAEGSHTMAPFATPTLTVFAVLITPLASPFPSWITIGFSVVCVVMLGAAVLFGEFRNRP